MTANSGQVVWTFKIRLLHWLMAISIIICLFIFNDGELIHIWLGYGTLVLVLIRTLIGLTSRGQDSFRNFPLAPSELISFIKNILNRGRKDYLGHNPAASYAYIVFWLLVVGLGVTGILLEHFEEFYGAQALEETHEIFANGVIVFLVVHFVGIGLDAFLHRRKTWMSMLHGKK